MTFTLFSTLYQSVPTCSKVIETFHVKKCSFPLYTPFLNIYNYNFLSQTKTKFYVSTKHISRHVPDFIDVTINKFTISGNM